jgi:plastocyanin
MADVSRFLPGALLVLGALFANGASSEELRGKVELVARGGKGRAAGADVRRAVVSFEPVSRQPVRPPAEPFVLATRQKQFVPRVLAVPRGSRVRFPNEDPILHNVFSVSPGNAFDLGLYKKSPGKARTFDNPGLVRVFCNVHHGMSAALLVLDTPFYTSPAADGTFVLGGLPQGHGKLTVWYEQGEPWTVDVRLPAAGPVTARVEVARSGVAPHLNKLGKPYASRDSYRDQ